MFWIATGIFLAVYAAIVADLTHKTNAALAGAALVLLAKALTQDQALHDPALGVDWNVIFLLIGMMVMVNVMTKTGVFQYLAVKSAKWGRGEPFRIMTVFAVVTAVVSALLDNVTTVLLIAPVTLLIAQELDIDPVPFLITEALASNIGGTATLIGDPPNIMIGSKAGLTFADFLIHLAPAVIVIMIVWLALWKVVFGRRLAVRPELRERIMAMREDECILDPGLLRKAGVILTLTVAGFALHGTLGYQPATVALAGAAALLLVSGEDPAKALAEVEWSTVFFFIGLFIVVGATVRCGLIDTLSRTMISLTKPTAESMFGLAMVTVWFSGLASAIIDNIPFVATMNPLLADLAQTTLGGGAEALRHPAMLPVWWALSLGACLGGNGTAIGASANVIVVGLAHKAGRPISFARFLKYGAPVTLMTLAVSTAYLYLRYYLLGW
jgi:Na+/H+ antiporter NhaD/arsenite permease-like protein